MKVSDVRMRAVQPDDPYDPTNIYLRHKVRTSQWRYVISMRINGRLEESTPEQPIYTCTCRMMFPTANHVNRRLVLRPAHPMKNFRWFLVDLKDWEGGVS